MVSRIYVLLVAAVIVEVIATTALARSESFTRLYPSIIVVVGYATAFYLLSFTLRTIPSGVVYAMWSGLGIVLVSAVAWLWYKQPLDAPAIVGIALILAGVVVIHVFSSAFRH